MKLVFGICSWGLGHATRTLPIMRKFIDEGDDVIAVSHGRALDLLKTELGDGAQYAELADYQPPRTLNPRVLALNTFLSAPQYITSMDREHRYVRRLVANQRVDAIFSDNRFGFYALDVPSFFMTHQLRLMNPLHLKTLEYGSEHFNRWFLDRFAAVIIPDFRDFAFFAFYCPGTELFDYLIFYISKLPSFFPKNNS